MLVTAEVFVSLFRFRSVCFIQIIVCSHSPSVRPPQYSLTLVRVSGSSLAAARALFTFWSTLAWADWYTDCGKQGQQGQAGAAGAHTLGSAVSDGSPCISWISDTRPCITRVSNDSPCARHIPVLCTVLCLLGDTLVVE